MNRDYEPISITEVNGLYDRSEFDDAVPEDHLIHAHNLIFSKGGFKTRPGTLLVETVGSINRFVRYKRLDEVSRFLILDGSGNLYDSTDMGIPILSIPAMVDFSATQYFNRIYITPHDRNRGIENEVVYVYDGTTCRPMGGNTPSGTLIAANSALSGNIDAGTHLFAISFETESGFVSAPGPALYAAVLADGSHQVDLSGIPIGPAGTVARRVLATRRIPEYAGNQNDYIFYYVPTGRIANNIDTTATVNFYDADLLSEADYLFDQLTSLPAGLGIGIYSDSLMIWGEYNNPSVLRLSRQGDPESFDAVSGYITVAPNDSGSLENATEFRDSLYMSKNHRTYTTVRDSVNPDAPIFWKVNNVDEGIGTTPFGIGVVLDTSGPNTDEIIYASRVGLMLFNGLFMKPELTWKVSSLWQSLSSDDFNKIQVYNDVVAQILYTLLPTGEMLVGDYKNGMSFQAIRWSTWSFPWSITSIGLDVDDTSENTPATLYLAGNGNLWRISSTTLNDDDEGIHTHVRYAFRALSEDGVVNSVTSVRFRVVGQGTLHCSLYGLDDIPETPLMDIPLQATPGKEILRLANLVNEKVSLEIMVDGASEYLQVHHVTLFIAPLWMERPNAT